MATWHQRRSMRRNPPELRHETGWTIVTDPPAGMMTLWTEPTEAAAKARLAVWAANGRDIRDCFILPPRPLDRS